MFDVIKLREIERKQIRRKYMKIRAISYILMLIVLAIVYFVFFTEIGKIVATIVSLIVLVVIASEILNFQLKYLINKRDGDK